MGIAERQERERRRRIEMILDAATVVIAEKGIEGAIMDDIAAAAELGKSTLYNYFASKQLLLAGLDLRGTKIEEEGFRSAYNAGKDGLDRALRIGRFYFKYAMEHTVCFQAKVQIGRISPAMFNRLKDDPLLKEYMQAVLRIHQILADALADGISDGTIRSDLDPQRMSLLLWCQSNGVIEITQNRGELLTAVRGVAMKQIEDDFFRVMELQLAAPGSDATMSHKQKDTDR
ncbi:MAG: TetR/AcrR family transcriptional regulator [Candidatus Eisenbacteria sp.]|nr:TetR/AcrR family transcriptional regulator [Candidatus Eisenbacteria bacterium]